MKQQRLLESALSQTLFELRPFLPCNALFIPKRGIAIHLSLGPRQIILFFSLFFFFNATPWHRAILLSRSATDLSATRWRLKKRETERHRSLGPRPILFFLTQPRGIERYYWLGPRPILVLFFFFNATPRHRAAPPSQSAIARVASVSVRFRSKERGTIVKPARKKWRK